MSIRPTHISITTTLIGGLIALGFSGCSSAADLGATPTRGLTSEITAITPDSTGGYAISLKLVNVDTGAIAYASYCPFFVEVWQGRRWATPAGDGSICRGTARPIDPGKTLLLTVHSAALSPGTVVRAVMPWMYLNGQLPGDSAVSGTASVR